MDSGANRVLSKPLNMDSLMTFLKGETLQGVCVCVCVCVCVKDKERDVVCERLCVSDGGGSFSSVTFFFSIVEFSFVYL